jgi:DNA-binding MarR family transcriptional regulator
VYIHINAMDFAEAARVISEECVCTRMRQASRALTKVYDDALRHTGIQTSQLTVLVAVARFGERGANINALADVLVIDRTTLSRNLGPMERLGWLRVARAPDDARLRVVLLTRAGERLIETAYPLWQKAQRQVRTLIGAKSADNLCHDAAGALSALGRPAGPVSAGSSRRRR